MLICYGTRPEWIKVKPVIEELRRRKLLFKTLFTGQHMDLVEGTNPDIQFDLGNGNNGNRLDSILAAIAMNFDRYSDEISKHTDVLVQGDTASALAVALCSFHRKKNIIHLEAGLRTYDIENPWPEEAYRSMISRITQLHLCPTPASMQNLERERAPGTKVLVGNTVLDNLVGVKTSEENIVLVTLHRRENIKYLDDWYNSIVKIVNNLPSYEFIFPMHKNPEVGRIINKLLLSNRNNITILEPLAHKDCIDILAKCKLVITDSGGLQEEACFLRKKVIVCRQFTERSESIGLNAKLVPLPWDLSYNLVNNFLAEKMLEYKDCPFGNGNSAALVVNSIQSLGGYDMYE